MSKKIGVLAMQGAYLKHLEMIHYLGAEAVEVREARQLETVDAMIIPGGESTVIAKLLIKNGIIDPLNDRIRSGMPVFGTCAGMILLAKQIEGNNQPGIKLMDITVKRNAYGRQIDSFEATFPVKGLDSPFTGIFIRAPKVVSCENGVEVLAEHNGIPVFLRQNNILASSFHPELTNNPGIHRLFLSMI